MVSVFLPKLCIFVRIENRFDHSLKEQFSVLIFVFLNLDEKKIHLCLLIPQIQISNFASNLGFVYRKLLCKYFKIFFFYFEKELSDRFGEQCGKTDTIKMDIREKSLSIFSFLDIFCSIFRAINMTEVLFFTKV